MKSIFTFYLILLGFGASYAQEDAMTITSNGNVGINITNPAEKLDVDGNVMVRGDISAKKVLAESITASGALRASSLTVTHDVQASKLNVDTVEATTVKATTINATGMIQQGGKELLPKGAIIMWYGSNTAPAGWAICNGENGTPDLRDKFVIGASESKKAKQTYGNNKISVENLPEHSHNIVFNDKVDNEKQSAKLMPFTTYKRKLGDGSYSSFDGGGYERNPIDFKDYINNLKTNNGNNIPTEQNQVEFVPKCYALYYIMKI